MTRPAGRGFERRRSAEALDARAILFQTPKSFEPTGENLAHLRTFCSEIDRRGRTLVFEPRGSAWTDEIVRHLATDLDLIHGMDPFLRSPTTSGLHYYRLHGRPEYTYSYSYTEEDFDVLEAEISEAGAAWVLFNNRTMADDARALQGRFESGSG